ncbi:MAG: choice-of-anchor D domain-containing protein [Candidatus Eisenbacteria bacterium]|jgi:hypothetical protein|nr:choice-of-anchor D domain-containing protein [Candidatus Eisenbacteria bacterium]
MIHRLHALHVLSSAFTFLVLLASASGASDPMPLGFPEIGIEPPSLGIDVVAGSSTEATFLVRNTGDGVLVVYAIDDDAVWMTETPTTFSVQASSSQTVTVSVDASGLPAGIYNQTISVSCNDPDEADVTVSVRVNVTQALGPDIWIRPSTIVVSVPSGQSTTETVMVGNSGGADLVVSSVTDDATWVSVSPTSFTVAPGDSQALTVEIQANPGEGAHQATITVASNDADEPTVQVSVTETTRALPWEPGTRLVLDAPAPNPFRTTTELRFELSQPADITLTVHDLAGRIVAILEQGPQDAGNHTVRWTATEESGRRVIPGLYTIRLNAGDTVRSVRAVMVR